MEKKDEFYLSVVDFLISIHFLVLRVINFFLSIYFTLTKRRKLNRLSKIDNELLLLPAVDLAEKIRKKQLSSEELIKLFIDRIFEVDKQINAVAGVNINKAIHDAKLIDQMVLEKSEKELEENFPFLGVPFSVKGCIEMKDYPFSAGVLERSKIKGTRDAEVVTLLKAAGAIPICVTNTPVLCMSWECYNPINGPTRNPYDLNRSSGGSSGGEAALIASGGSIIGIGSDFAGSIRNPAAFCGVFGHKPTRDIINIDGYYPPINDELFRSFVVVGPITRYAKDLAPMLNILSRKNPKLKLNEPISINDIKILFKHNVEGDILENLKWPNVCDEIKSCVTKITNFLSQKGCTVEEANIKDISKLGNIFTALVLESKPSDLMECMKEHTGKNDNVWLELLKSIFGRSDYTLPALVLNASSKIRSLVPKEAFALNRKRVEEVKNNFLSLLNENGVLVFPTFPIPAFHTYGSIPLWSCLVYTIVFNAIGFPATYIPMGLNKDGLPIGVQVVAAPYQDRLCLTVANCVEKEFRGWVPPFS